MAIEPITAEQGIDFNIWLAEHNLIKKKSMKRMRIYRKTDNQYRVASRDFVYVVSADDYRADLEGVHKILIEKSMKVMDPEERVKNEEYNRKMSEIEKRLLLEHHIEMNWFNAKSVSFNKIVHVITDPLVVSTYDNYLKETRPTYKSMSLERFRCGAKIESCGINFSFDWLDKDYFNVETENGKILCVYSTSDAIPLESKSFAPGIFDKFGYNLGICDDETINSVIAKSKEWDERLSIV